MKRLHGWVAAAVLGGLMALPVAVARPAAAVVDTGDGETWRVSLSATGGDPNKASSRARISQDGNHSCFQTNSSNMVGADLSIPTSTGSTSRTRPRPSPGESASHRPGANPNDASTFCEISRRRAVRHVLVDLPPTCHGPVAVRGLRA